jgi:hypothetical protein
VVIDAQRGFSPLLHNAMITVDTNTVTVRRTGTRSGKPPVFATPQTADTVELTPATLAKLSFNVTTKDRMNGTCQDKDNDKRPTATWWKSEDSKCVEVKLKPNATPYDKKITPFANLLLNPANPFIINFKSIKECDDFKNQVANIVLDANAAAGANGGGIKRSVTKRSVTKRSVTKRSVTKRSVTKRSVTKRSVTNRNQKESGSSQHGLTKKRPTKRLTKKKKQ